MFREKGITTDIQNVDGKKVPEDLYLIHTLQYQLSLTGASIYDSGVIIEYLDERYPHPPLMPVSPVDRAKIRLASFP